MANSLKYGSTRSLRWDSLLRKIVGYALSRFRAVSRALTRKWIDWRFDRLAAVDTGGLIGVSQLGSTGLEYAEQYEATRPGIFRDILKSLPIDYRNFNFIDLGCGKGRALLLAAELPFQQIIGVEISQPLSKIAEQNIKTSRIITEAQCSRIRVICMDAGDFLLPEHNAVLYLYNPFKEEVVRKVADNIRTSLLAAKGEVIVAYYNPVAGKIFEDVAGLTRIVEARTRTSSYAIYRSAAAHN